MIATQTLNLDFNKKDYRNSFILNQGDINVPFRVQLYDSGKRYKLLATDMVSIEWKKPNGNPFFQSTGITKNIDENYLEFTTPEAVAQFAGKGFLNIILTENDNRKGTIQRHFEVVESGVNPKEITEGVISDVVKELETFIAQNQVATKLDLQQLESKLSVGKNIYSTDEIAIGKWIDNKTIYRKVIDLGYLPADSTKTTQIKEVNAVISNLDKVISVTGLAYGDDADNYMAINLPGCIGTQYINIYYQQSKIKIETGETIIDMKAYAIIEYTKTTD